MCYISLIKIIARLERKVIMADRIMVGMSGGVDSAVSAALLREQGWDVAGATFRLWDGCGASGDRDIRDAAEVCSRLGIPHHVLDLRDIFRERVVEPFIAGYASGVTPNPCIFCNKGVKFGAFLEYACALGYANIATGHYAIVERDGDRYRLRRGADARKDQSYVLYHLTAEQLAAVQFPLGRMTKDEVRAAARERGITSVNRAESQDICFVPGGDYAAFLEGEGVSFTPGDFVDTEGKPLGRHLGIGRYTVGQRRGTGISLGKPTFVKAIDPAANTVVLSDGAELWATGLTATDARWIEPPRSRLTQVQAKIRYAHKAQPAEVEVLDGGNLRVLFSEPVRAITPGQAVVFYDGEYVIGGATIL
jgi:tRNA-specific 2-thiouridylase